MRRPTPSGGRYVEVVQATAHDDLDDILLARPSTSETEDSAPAPLAATVPQSPDIEMTQLPSSESSPPNDARSTIAWRSAYYAVGHTSHSTWAEEAEAALPCLRSTRTDEPPDCDAPSGWEYWTRLLRPRRHLAMGTPIATEGEILAGTVPAVSARDPDGCPCTVVSAVLSVLLCPRARRLGNMLVLDAGERPDDEGGGIDAVAPPLRRVVGPYWPMMVFVTYPIIFGVSGLVLWKVFWPRPASAYENGTPPHPGLFLGWIVLTAGLVAALFFTACKDPGIVPRMSSVPPATQEQFRWDDRALTYRARGAQYDHDCQVVVEEFDHVCPWTGTAIGKKNMPAFQAFLCTLFATLALDVVLLTTLSANKSL